MGGGCHTWHGPPIPGHLWRDNLWRDKWAALNGPLSRQVHRRLVVDHPGAAAACTRYLVPQASTLLLSVEGSQLENPDLPNLHPRHSDLNPEPRTVSREYPALNPIPYTLNLIV